jgi:hypothetical protein
MADNSSNNSTTTSNDIPGPNIPISKTPETAIKLSNDEPSPNEASTECATQNNLPTTIDMKAYHNNAQKKYYATHREAILEKRKQARADGGSVLGNKLRINTAKYAYKKKPSVTRAITLYALLHRISANDIAVSVQEIVKEVNAYVSPCEA